MDIKKCMCGCKVFDKLGNVKFCATGVIECGLKIIAGNGNLVRQFRHLWSDTGAEYYMDGDK